MSSKVTGKRPHLAHLWRKVRTWIIAEDKKGHPRKQRNVQQVFSKKFIPTICASSFMRLYSRVPGDPGGETTWFLV